MIKIQLYWNNICILHRQELVFLDRIRSDLRQKGLDLNVRCFGLGYSHHMSEYLMEPEAILPDIVVSADLEVFEDQRIYIRLAESGLHPLANCLPVKQAECVRRLHRSDCLLPYLAIPLVFFADSRKFGGSDSICLDQLVKEGYPLTFGGVENSAAKTVVKTIWESCGPDNARRFLSNCTVTHMPIQAFQSVRTGEAALALVPSVYALRADGRQKKAFWPADGAVAVPSYICARKTIPEDAALTVINALRAPQISHFYVNNGCLISCSPQSPKDIWMSDSGLLRLPSPGFLETLTAGSFYELYRNCLGTETATSA